MTQVVDDSLAAGREAARRHAWRDANELLRSADGDGRLEAEDLQDLGELKRFDEPVELVSVGWR